MSLASKDNAVQLLSHQITVLSIYADSTTSVARCEEAGSEITSVPPPNIVRDTDNVFNGANIIVDADPNTFTLLCADGYEGSNKYLCAYALDKNHVFHLTGYTASDTYAVIPGADPGTFETVDPEESCGHSCSYDARDRDHEYQFGHSVK